MATQVQTFIDTVNTEYEKAHLSYEENFWSTKMALTGNSADALVETKKQLDSFLGDKAKLEEVRKLRKEFEAQLTADQKRALDIFARTFESYIIEVRRSDSSFLCDLCSGSTIHNHPQPST